MYGIFDDVTGALIFFYARVQGLLKVGNFFQVMHGKKTTAPQTSFTLPPECGVVPKSSRDFMAANIKRAATNSKTFR